MKTFKKLLRKILKCLIIVIAIFAIYVTVCFFQSKTLITELTDAVYRDDIEKIYELTGNNFYEDYNYNDRVHENKSIYDLLKDENYAHILCDNGLNSFSYDIKGVKPSWQGFLYEIDITMTNYENLYLSGENIKKLLENEDMYIKKMQNYSINGDKSYIEHLSNEVTQYIYLDDMEFEKYGTITLPVSLIYNIFTRKVISIDDFYVTRKGGMHNAMALAGINALYMTSFSENIDFIEFYSQSGDAYCVNFYDDVFISIDNQHNNKNIKDWTEINKYFIENDKSKNEIIQFLSGEGYIFAEKIIFSSPEEEIEIAFYNDKYVWSNNEEIRDYFSKNNFNKKEIISMLEDYGCYLGERLRFKKNGNDIEIFFKDEELMWLTGTDSEMLTQYIVRNNLEYDEIIDFLLKEGYVEF